MKMLPCWLPFLLRLRMRQKNSNAAMRAAPTTEPTTIPAIAPPDRPFGSLEAAGVLDGDAVEFPEGVAVGRLSVGIIDGRTTPAHRLVTLEL